MTALAAKNLLVGVAVAQIVHLGERRCLVIDTSIATRADISSDDEGWYKFNAKLARQRKLMSHAVQWSG